MAERKRKAYDAADKFTWKPGDVKIYKNEAEWRADAARRKAEAAAVTKAGAAKPKKGTTAKKKK